MSGFCTTFIKFVMLDSIVQLPVQVQVKAQVQVTRDIMLSPAKQFKIYKSMKMYAQICKIIEPFTKESKSKQKEDKLCKIINNKKFKSIKQYTKVYKSS